MQPTNRRCQRCGAAFLCEYAVGADSCWCGRDFAPALPLPQGEGCLCPDCLREAVRRSTAARRQDRKP